MVSSLQFNTVLAGHRYSAQNAVKSVRFGDETAETESDKKENQNTQGTSKQGIWSYISGLIKQIFEKLNLGDLVGKLKSCISEWFSQFGKTEEVKKEEVKQENSQAEVKKEDTNSSIEQTDTNNN